MGNSLSKWNTPAMKLTQTVKKGGCAAKVPAMVLREILANVQFPPKIPGLLVDGALFDDAAIFEINHEVALVQTLDFFTPILDDPKDFGAVAAANALSDVYAMGGRPKTCMAILAAPLATMGPEVIQDVLQGACDVISESQSSLVGGHSIDDDTLKFGLSVTGIVHPKKIWKNDGARVNDLLILTKPLGTGTLCAGLKQGNFSQDDLVEAISSMKRLNNIVDYLKTTEHIHGATDVTGFGLAGHSYQMALASKVSFHFLLKDVPLFELTRNSIEANHLTKAHRSNADYTKLALRFGLTLSEIDKLIMYDPQTSGGLLISVKASEAHAIVNELSLHFPKTSIIGEVKEYKDHYVIVE